MGKLSWVHMLHTGTSYNTLLTSYRDIAGHTRARIETKRIGPSYLYKQTCTRNNSTYIQS